MGENLKAEHAKHLSRVNENKPHKAVLLGSYDGFAGPGIGAFWTVSSIRLHKLPLLNSCALARVMTSVSNVTALIIFALLRRSRLDFRFMDGCMHDGRLIYWSKIRDQVRYTFY